MSDETEKLRVRIKILEAELASASGCVLAIAEHFEEESGLDDGLVQDLHQRAARWRKLSGVSAPGGVQ